MKVWVSEHEGMYSRTGKQVKGTLSTAVRNMFNCSHVVTLEDFSIISIEPNHL